MNYHLELKNVTKQFGPTEIIRGVNLNIKKGEIHSLIGPNGAGKSTLYNLISGVYKLTSGTIRGTSLSILKYFELSITTVFLEAFFAYFLQ